MQHPVDEELCRLVPHLVEPRVLAVLHHAQKQETAQPNNIAEKHQLREMNVCSLIILPGRPCHDEVTLHELPPRLLAAVVADVRQEREGGGSGQVVELLRAEDRRHRPARRLQPHVHRHQVGPRRRRRQPRPARPRKVHHQGLLLNGLFIYVTVFCLFRNFCLFLLSLCIFVCFLLEQNSCAFFCASVAFLMFRILTILTIVFRFIDNE